MFAAKFHNLPQAGNSVLLRARLKRSSPSPSHTQSLHELISCCFTGRRWFSASSAKHPGEGELKIDVLTSPYRPSQVPKDLEGLIKFRGEWLCDAKKRYTAFEAKPQVLEGKPTWREYRLESICVVADMIRGIARYPQWNVLAQEPSETTKLLASEAEKKSEPKFDTERRAGKVTKLTATVPRKEKRAAPKAEKSADSPDAQHMALLVPDFFEPETKMAQLAFSSPLNHLNCIRVLQEKARTKMFEHTFPISGTNLLARVLPLMHQQLPQDQFSGLYFDSDIGAAKSDPNKLFTFRLPSSEIHYAHAATLGVIAEDLILSGNGADDQVLGLPLIVVHLPHKEWTPQMKNSLRRYMPYRGISIDGAEYIRAYSCKDWLDAYTIANEIDPKHAGEVTILPLYHVLEQIHKHEAFKGIALNPLEGDLLKSIPKHSHFSATIEYFGKAPPPVPADSRSEEYFQALGEVKQANAAANASAKGGKKK